MIPVVWRDALGREAYISLWLAHHPKLEMMQASLQKDVRVAEWASGSPVWQDPATFHITLVYIYDVSDEELELVCNVLRNRFTDPIPISVREVKTFNNEDGSTLYLDVFPAPALMEWQAMCYDACSQAELPLSEYSLPQQYHPHISMVSDPQSGKEVSFPIVPMNLMAAVVDVSQGDYQSVDRITPVRVGMGARKRIGPSPEQIAAYEQAETDAKNTFRQIAGAWLAGTMSLAVMREAFQDALRQHYVRLAFLGRNGREIGKRGRADLQKLLARSYDYLDGFVRDLSSYKTMRSDDGVLSRAGSYGPAWGVFTRYTIPDALAAILPALPGIDCLGNGNCGCVLEVSRGDDFIEVYWIMNPIKEHCILCTDFSGGWSPLVLSFEDLGEELDEEELEELLDDLEG